MTLNSTMRCQDCICQGARHHSMMLGSACSHLLDLVLLSVSAGLDEESQQHLTCAAGSLATQALKVITVLRVAD